MLGYWEALGWIHSIPDLREPHHSAEPVAVVLDGDAARSRCGICKHPIELVLPYGWTHDITKTVDVDHPPVPVPLDQVQTVGRCDFCHLDHPQFLIPCRPFTLDLLPSSGSSADWAACRTCAELIDTNQWTQLRNRAVSSLGHSSEIAATDAHLLLRRLFAQVRSNMTGTSRLIR